MNFWWQVSKATRELRPQGSPKLTYNYTSGTLVHGDNHNEIVPDTPSPLLRTMNQLIAWRSGREQEVITDVNLDGIVIRPSFMYGRSGARLAPFFQSTSEGNVWYPGFLEAGLWSSTGIVCEGDCRFASMLEWIVY